MNLINILAQIAFTWTGAMGWHLWRIAIGRPAYRWITDTGTSDLSFLLVFFIASALRWSVAHGSEWLVFLASTAATLFVLGAFTLRSTRSDSLFCAVLGAHSLVAFAGTAATVLGLTESPLGLHPAGLLSLVVEVALYAVCVLQFFREEPAVRKNGYGRERVRPYV